MTKLARGDVMPGCPARFETPDRDLLLCPVAGHAAEAHGITDITPDLRQAIEARIAS